VQDIDTKKPPSSRRSSIPRCGFRPLLAPATLIVAGLLITLSCFHYYTAGFGLLRETTHRGVHLAFVLGLSCSCFRRARARSNMRGRRAGMRRVACR
jgi:TRAP-type uncharacterized transport system fused permease subunit